LGGALTENGSKKKRKRTKEKKLLLKRFRGQGIGGTRRRQEGLPGGAFWVQQKKEMSSRGKKKIFGKNVAIQEKKMGRVKTGIRSL